MEVGIEPARQALGDHHRRESAAQAYMDAAVRGLLLALLLAQPLDQRQHQVRAGGGHVAEGVATAAIDHLDRLAVGRVLGDPVPMGDLLGEVQLARRLEEEVIAPGRFPEERIDPLARQVFPTPGPMEPLGDRRGRAHSVLVRLAARGSWWRPRCVRNRSQTANTSSSLSCEGCQRFFLGMIDPLPRADRRGVFRRNRPSHSHGCMRTRDSRQPARESGNAFGERQAAPRRLGRARTAPRACTLNLSGAFSPGKLAPPAAARDNHNPGPVCE